MRLFGGNRRLVRWRESPGRFLGCTLWGPSARRQSILQPRQTASLALRDVAMSQPSSAPRASSGGTTLPLPMQLLIPKGGSNPIQQSHFDRQRIQMNSTKARLAKSRQKLRIISPTTLACCEPQGH